MRTINDLLVVTLLVNDLLGLIEPSLEEKLGQLSEEEFRFFLQELGKLEIPKAFYQVFRRKGDKYYHIGSYLSFLPIKKSDEILMGIADQVLLMRQKA
ncbi:MAG: hypothetical protein ACOZAO_00630 [Patescibacteria group bacterium]